ncbi:unnamed protein product [Auanema sp. JU1783]|nr:unnamed protein product [Auanema sp. JU1783]
MTKYKSKAQKKQFFSHPRNRDRVFTKREPDPEQEQSFKPQSTYAVLSPEGIEQIPSCSHGPCLLFGVKKQGEIVRKFFACAVYRENPEECAYKCELREDGSLGMPENCPPLPFPGQQKPKWDYGVIPKKLKTISLHAELLYCRLCDDVFEGKHRCPCEPVTRKQLKNPSKLLESLESQTGEAQYFFSDDALSVMTAAIKNAKIDGVLCIGAPRLFETLKNDKEDKKHIFMLDFDRRYAHFYQSLQYAQYSMLVDHFFDPKAEQKLNNFFAKCSSLLIVCDPPFGVILDPLVESIKKNIARYMAARKGKKSKVNTAYIVPFFLDKHIMRLDPSFWLCDYRVTYDNHKNFSKSKRTSVRIISDLDKNVFDLKDVPGYHFCDMCEIYVSDDNHHCYMCMKCVSRDGSKYVHCDRCMRCVKEMYNHCRLCERCHPMSRGCTANRKAY